jgi:hypothetical protein
MVVDGVPCDDRNLCTVDAMCTGGVCVGTPKCGPTRPCFANCDPASGQSACCMPAIYMMLADRLTPYLRV